MNKVNIVQVIGPVVDVEFSDTKSLPKIYNALEIEYEVNGNPTKLTLEVQQQSRRKLGPTIAMSSTEGLKRGMSVNDTGAPISVPVAKACSAGYSMSPADAVDNRGPVKFTNAIDSPPCAGTNGSGHKIQIPRKPESKSSI